jgi:hypothetical protein
MSFPQVLEVALGLILIYYVLGAIVSTVTQTVMESLETRGVALEKYLKRIAGGKTVDLTNLPQIKALRPIRYVRWWSIFGGSTEEKKLERIPVETLVDAFFDLSGLTGRGVVSAGELTGLIDKLPDSEGKQALLGWIEQGVTAINDLRSRAYSYFGGLLSQAALTFKARARSFVIACSITITVLCGADSIQIAKDLWTDAGLRSLAAHQVQVAASQPDSATPLDGVISQIGALPFFTGWWHAESVPPPAPTADWFIYVGLKLLGLAITAAAVSQGSSFWYDLLKKLTGSSSSRPPDPGDAAGAVG